MSTKAVLSKKSLVLVFAYAPLGFGHLRVTDALYHGLPEEITPHLLSSQDKAISVLYRMLSTNPYLRLVMEWVQHGTPQDIFTFCYRLFLRTHTTLLYQQLVTLLDEQIEEPETILLVATHFGLAHQLAEIKSRLAKEKNVEITLVVQVTDDSPQPIWYVSGADMIFVPSWHTKHRLERFGEKLDQNTTPVRVLPYPVSPLLAAPLAKRNTANRLTQLSPVSDATIHLAVPVSGAAVGTEFLTRLIDRVEEGKRNVRFHLVVKSTSFTDSFLHRMLPKKSVNVYTAENDRDMVEIYEQLYRHHTISLEITKPSEQAFKALLDPTHVGGAVLLFAKPVGKQEYHNLSFLLRHHLVPTLAETELLWERAQNGTSLSPKQHDMLWIRALSWRGLLLPDDPLHAADLITWALKAGLFSAMSHKKVIARHEPQQDELSPHGVKRFWEEVAAIIAEQD